MIPYGAPAVQLLPEDPTYANQTGGAHRLSMRMSPEEHCLTY